MQNSDGSTVYGEGNQERTFPCHPYSEDAVVAFVKEEHLRRTVLDKPSLSEQIQTAAARAEESQLTEEESTKDIDVVR